MYHNSTEHEREYTVNAQIFAWVMSTFVLGRFYSQRLGKPAVRLRHV